MPCKCVLLIVFSSMHAIKKYLINVLYAHACAQLINEHKNVNNMFACSLTRLLSDIMMIDVMSCDA